MSDAFVPTFPSRAWVPTIDTKFDALSFSFPGLAGAALAVLTLASAACGDEPAPSQAENDAADPDGGVKVVEVDKGNRPLPNLPAEWLTRFHAGDALFEQNYFDAQGIGPVFIRAACAACHANDARGPGAVRKMVLLDGAGAPLLDQSGLHFGHTIRPQTIPGVDTGITAPEDTTNMLITVRMPPSVIGRGYLEAIDGAEIERVQAEQAERNDGVSGRINWVTYTSQTNVESSFAQHAPGDRLIGRFGLKARIATLDDFTADALQGDMGLTSPMRPDELPHPADLEDLRPGVDVTLATVNFVADYTRMLRIPARKQLETNKRGAELFESAQCSACHVPTLHTSPNYALPALADSDAPVYSDLLLHDMGPGFSDGIEEFTASSTEWRTAPLLGLRFMTSYLHDGRASTIEQAIELHGGAGSEATQSVRTFLDMDDASRSELVAFVAAL